jgi:hypothetical protein
MTDEGVDSYIGEELAELHAEDCCSFSGLFFLSASRRFSIQWIAICNPLDRES